MVSIAPDKSVVFRTTDLIKIYQMGEVQMHALRGIDLELYAGKMVVLLGTFDSGESTFLNILSGLDIPTAGQVSYLGSDLTQASEREMTDYRRYHIGFAFQFYSLIPSLTARENIAVVMEVSRTAILQN